MIALGGDTPVKHFEVFSALEKKLDLHEFAETVKALCGNNVVEHSNCHGSGGSHVGPCSGQTRHTCTGGAMNISPPSCRQNLCSPTSSYYTPGCCDVSSHREPSGA